MGIYVLMRSTHDQRHIFWEYGLIVQVFNSLEMSRLELLMIIMLSKMFASISRPLNAPSLDDEGVLTTPYNQTDSTLSNIRTISCPITGNQTPERLIGFHTRWSDASPITIMLRDNGAENNTKALSLGFSTTTIRFFNRSTLFMFLNGSQIQNCDRLAFQNHLLILYGWSNTLYYHDIVLFHSLNPPP